VFVEELPRADAAEGASRISVLTRVGIPVFLAPSRRVSKAELAFLPPEAGRIRASLRNGGTVRLRPSTVTLAVLSADGARLLERALDGWYVLAGGERVYEVEVPPELCARAAEAVITAALDGGTVEARAAGACRGP
jgi:fimbrial chaperone protein